MPVHRRQLLEFPKWLGAAEQRLLEEKGMSVRSSGGNGGGEKESSVLLWLGLRVVVDSDYAVGGRGCNSEILTWEHDYMVSSLIVLLA